MTAEPRAERRVGRPPRITREQILEVGLALADSDGLDAVSMRRLAAILGVQPPSLYNHVKTKEEVLDGAADRVMSEVDATSFDTDHWAAALERWARSYYSALVSHPKMIPWFARGAQRGPRSLENADRVAGGLIRAQWSPRDATLIAASTVNLVYGAAFDSFAAGFPDDPSAYPGSIRNLQKAHELRAHSTKIDRDAFELGLRLHLQGLQQLHREVVHGHAPSLSRQVVEPWRLDD